MKTNIFIQAFIILFVIFVAISTFFIYKQDDSNITEPIRPTSKDITSTPRSIPNGWKEYSNETYNFSISYPENLSVLSFDEGSGASTFTFQNIASGEGFQIYVLPYADTHITEERFKKDVPTNVMLERNSLSVGEVPAIEFYSTDVMLGETKEVWFIQNGYLYEVTTVKLLEEWLMGIIDTWRFI